MTDIVVAIVTYKRPLTLATAVGAVLFEIESLGEDASLIIVDNDPDQSARPVIDDVRSNRVEYVLEPRAGIAAAIGSS